MLATMTSLEPHWDLYPKSYVAPRVKAPMMIDGDIDKSVWRDVPWSAYFDDIRGARDAPPDERPSDGCRTRFKAAWDEEYLYIGAVIQSDMPVIAHFKERNSPIFQQDSDFEVFVDPIGSCHGYKELEVNPINTVWNLLLDKPYMDGGSEHSGRIANPGEKLYYDVSNQKTATRLLNGKLNDPSSRATWALEIALSFKDLLSNVTSDTSFRPENGSMMRINFSRVEHQGKINWTWQPQIVWDPVERRHKGYVNMHLPDAWGVIVLSNQTNRDEPTPIPLDASWAPRLTAMHVYYAQHEHRRQIGSYAQNIQDLSGMVDPAIVGPFEIDIAPTFTEDGAGFIVVVLGAENGMVVSVTHDRKLTVGVAANEKDRKLSK